MNEPTDATLVARVRAGDRGAAGQLLGRYLRGSRAVALAILGEVAEAEDVCQDAFVAAIEQIDACRRPERFGQWLFQIVRNRAKDVLRSSRFRASVRLDAAALEHAPSAPDAAVAAELRTRLLAALATLPGAQREAILLHDLEGWKHHEIAELMDLPAGTVRSHVHHARTRLRVLLKDLQPGESG